MDYTTALLIATGSLASAIVILWRYTEARLDKVQSGYRAAIDSMRAEHKDEIAALVARLDRAETGRLEDSRQYSRELAAISDRSIAALNEASQCYRQVANSIHRIPCQNIALRPLDANGE